MTDEPKVTTWLDGFKDALAKVLVAKGTIIQTRTMYGRVTYDEAMCHVRESWRQQRIESDKKYAKHIRPDEFRAVDIPQWCGNWALITDLREEVRSEFEDTDCDNRRVNLVVATVTCACGFVNGERLEYEATTGELLREVLDIGPKRIYGDEDYDRRDRDASREWRDK